MAVKKSELYSSLWASCDELRGGMDASEYKDYVLLMLFLKYISDKYAGVPFAPITVPEGASFADMVAMKGTISIGDDINKKIIAPIEEANKSLGSIKVDFDNPEKLGAGKEKVDRLTKLIAIFEGLNFSKNNAAGDDLLGDAYEYLMRNFAKDSGKSKGQFYTPAEVSRIMAKIIGIDNENTTANTTIYDPTCGSGSLLLKVADEADRKITIYGQEKESTTAGLARMNMVLHGCPSAMIRCTGNSTLSDPQFKDEGGGLKRFDFVVANPPFSSKNWSNGLFVDDQNADTYGRFAGFGVPPAKNGDFAFLLHMVKSLKSTGKAAVILPHGVLFRGNAEATIRKNLIERGLIKAIIGLPANLFFGTGIPACLLLLDKEGANSRKGIFMVDASKGYEKDGPKNRLRDQDIHKIVDVCNKQLELPKYSRMVATTEIEENEFNLNLPRYIDNQEEEDIEDIEAHLKGGIPSADIEALNKYWEVYPSLKDSLFKPTSRNGYFDLTIDKSAIKQTIFEHPEFKAHYDRIETIHRSWKENTIPLLKEMEKGLVPKKLIHAISEDLLSNFSTLRIIDKYDVYQHLMSYWTEVMQDDCYLISEDGWLTELKVIDPKRRNKELECELVPKYLVVNRFFRTKKEAIELAEAELSDISSQLDELEEEHGAEDGLMAECRNDKDKITLSSIKDRLKRIKSSKEDAEERKLLNAYLLLANEKAEQAKKINQMRAELEDKTIKRYDTLTFEEIQSLVIDVKWMNSLNEAINSEMQRISQRLTQRVKDLAERYETPVTLQLEKVKELEEKVNAHLAKMGFVCK